MRIFIMHIKYFIGLIVILFLLACEDEKEMQEWISNTEKLKITAEQEGKVVPYREKQFKTLKSYFEKINLTVLSLKDDKDKTKKFNEALSNRDIDQFCEQILLDYEQWQRMVQRCTKNNFFLCSEEVLSYQDMLGVLRDLLNGKQRQRFDNAQHCQEAIRINSDHVSVGQARN